MTQTEIFSFVVQTLYWFFLYGCIGWGVEVVYAAITERRRVNRGFLCGPARQRGCRLGDPNGPGDRRQHAPKH